MSTFPILIKNAAKQACLFVRDMLAPFSSAPEVAILCYHSVSESVHPTAVRPEALEVHLGFLQEMGHTFVSLEDIMAWHAGTKPLPSRAVALTFDDGYADFETTVVPLLKKFNAPAAVFVIGETSEAAYRLDEQPFMTPEVLERVAQEPLVEVGYHSRTHPNLDELPEYSLPAEVTPPPGLRFFAYPGGHHSRDAVRALERAGYAAAFTIRPTLVSRDSDQYLMPRTVVLKGMRPWQLRFATTRASRWYMALRAKLI